MLSQFFADLLPQRGNFALWTKHNKKHHWTDSHDGLIALSEHLADTPDTYYATAAFGDETSAKTGLTARTQDNVIARRCLHADFDCGPEKQAKDPDGTYPDQRAAAADIKKFETETGIRFTYILSSGTGLHAYLALTEDVDNDQWMKLAKAFQKLAKQVGIKLDDSCTTDSARVLRAPGALHSNGKRVQIIQRREVFYEPNAFGLQVVSLLDEKPLPEAPKRKRSGINDDVLKVEGPPKSIKNIAPKCKAVAELITKRGNVTEPFWRAGLGVAKFTVEGFEAAKVMSMGHPEYDEGATLDKFDRWATGPSTCSEFAKYCRGCHSCPQFGVIKSPIVLGAMTTVQVESLPPEQQPEAVKPPAPTGDPWDGRIPSGFKVKPVNGMTSLVWAMPVENENEDGDKVTAYVDVPFSNDVFWFSQWADAEHSDDGAQVIMCKLDGKSSKSYVMPQTLIGNQTKLREVFAGKSIFTTTHKHASRAMEEYTKAQINRIRNIGQKPKINTRFGVRILNNGDLIAAQGDKVIYPNGEIREGMLDDSLKGMAHAFNIPLPESPDGMWGADVWDSHILPAARKHAAFMKKHYGKPGMEKFQLAAMMAFASPLMPFVTGEYHKGMSLPATGFSVSLYSRKGGRGKTTLMRAAVLAYGVPTELSKDANNTGATDKARIARMTLLGSCPVGMDEMGSNTASTVSNLVSAIANGSGRDRAKVDGGLSIGATWALSCLIAANKSQREMIAAASAESSAIQYRMIELDVQDMPEFSLEERAEFTNEWSEVVKCAGAVGASIHRRICEMGADKVNKLVVQAGNKAATLMGEDQTTRFQYRALGAIIACHMILKQDGLCMFDVGGVIAEFKKALEGVSEFVAENLLPDDELELLSMFLNDHMDSTLVTHNMSRRTGVVKTVDMPVGNEPSNVLVRHVISTRRSYVNAEAFRAWCAERALPMNSIIHECVAKGAIEKPKTGAARIKTYANLYGGTARSSEARVWCYVVNMGKLNAMLGREDTEYPDNVVELKRPDADPPAEAEQKAS